MSISISMFVAQLLLPLFMAPMLLLGATGITAVKETPTPEVAKLGFRLDQVLLTTAGGTDGGNLLEFDVYLERPDIGKKQPKHTDGKYTVDLPKELQPSLIYVSDISDRDPESGSMCDRPRFPHRCTVTIPSDEEGAKTENKFLVKVTFEDGVYAEKEITLPYVGEMSRPEITEPTSTPRQGEKFSMKFRDVGADKYDVTVGLCKPYGNDGINPCLDGMEYYLSRVNGRRNGPLVLKGTNSQGEEVGLSADGFVTLKSNLPINYQESVEYTVVATQTGTTTGGIKTFHKSSATKSFKKLP